MSVDWRSAFEKINGLRALVIGDVMLDRYLWGKVERLSPEAPAPIVDLEFEEERPGGAANVAANVAGLGAASVTIGFIGDDRDGQTLTRVIPGDFRPVVCSKRPTTVKTRVMGEGRQLVRVDRENSAPPDDDETKALLNLVFDEIKRFAPHAVILQDYDKGVLCEKTIRRIVDECGVPVFADPKRRNFQAYAGVAVFKPNVKELSAGIGKKLRRDDIPALIEATRELRKTMPHACTLVTMSEHGALWMDETEEAIHLPAHVRQITDVSGAGDAVVATMACLCAAGVPYLEAARAANRAGGWVCEKPGVTPVEAQALLNELLHA
ncbi:MAG: PfkB family carbohydrate kinase [Bacteroidia bacterium]|nr:PfkB family carbohydrate kinase [Bacteroidia bacterium]MDW8334618.1 PfkB family carbohydrate kinase [Bacteroidia bacterium]